jgi:predicted enzyme related to lactoylglutathione lyase
LVPPCPARKNKAKHNGKNGRHDGHNDGDGVAKAERDMEKVVGIGGLFFRSRDPQALKAWYAEHLGVGPAEGAPAWTQDAGMTAFEPFSETSEYFPADRRFMLNFRVANLDAMLAQLSAAGIEIAQQEDYPYGRFARIHDPEGNPIELWEPA